MAIDNREPSRALPMRFYRDPVEVVERNQLEELGCYACTRGQTVFNKLVCMDKRNEKQKGVPRIGHKCRFFDERLA